MSPRRHPAPFAGLVLLAAVSCGRVDPGDAGTDAAVADSSPTDACLPTGASCVDGFASLIDQCCIKACGVGPETDGAVLCGH
jgi:hypothetical protein